MPNYRSRSPSPRYRTNSRTPDRQPYGRKSSPSQNSYRNRSPQFNRNRDRSPQYRRGNSPGGYRGGRSPDRFRRSPPRRRSPDGHRGGDRGGYNNRNRSPPRDSRNSDGGNKAHGGANDMFSVLINGFRESSTEANVKKYFEKFGFVADVFFPKDKETGNHRSFGFVRYAEKEHQEAAMREFDRYGIEFEGRTLKCDYAKPRPVFYADKNARNPRFGGNQGRFGGGDRMPSNRNFYDRVRRSRSPPGRGDRRTSRSRSRSNSYSREKSPNGVDRRSRSQS